MKKIHVLPKNIFNQLGVDHYGKTSNRIKIEEYLIAKNIYITSDEEIEKDYVIAYGVVIKVMMFNKETLYFVNGTKAKREECKKIILTTDQDLIKDGVQAIDDEFLEWFVKNPSCEEVKVTKIQYNPVFDEDDLSYDGMTAYYNYKIIIPKEETIDEGEGEAYRQELFNYLYDNFGAIASELEMRDIEIIVLRTEVLKDKQEQDKNKYSELAKLRNELYEQLPTGKSNAFDLIKIINNHINRIDELI